MKRKMVVFIYCGAVIDEDKIPSAGNNIKGIKEVTASGTDSKTHQVAIRDATAATNFAL
jgi:hypothetical protein